jgi:nicotinate-nucleotide adenylyltransferase
MNIGIYAGTFDPIHNGHIGFAKKAIESGNLDRIIVVAEKEPYRKKPVASWDHRQAMIERATEFIDQVEHDYGFASQLAHKHTMQDMLTMARKHYGSDNQFWFLVGSDVFEHIHQWKDILAENEYGGFIVALRDDHTNDWLNQKTELLKERMPVNSIVVLDSTHPRISSTKIRDNIKRNLESNYLPGQVLSYAVTHKIYN